MNELTQQQCRPCHGGALPLDRQEVDRLLGELPDWKLNDSATRISRLFQWRDFYQTMAFVNAVAWVAHQEDHHPDLEIGYNRCLVQYTTHGVGGLSHNDFICAAKVDAMFAREGLAIRKP
ncbi:MAG: 4a-hydroxytetrahydrobiopterin dehydratase [Magnetococcales bacterium]|nr:4a-hydroxytetrahydrobiopterin dehydratase [Magnetococcales bacterium]